MFPNTAIDDFKKPRLVVVDEVEIAVHTSGNGPTVIGLHATGHDSMDFLPLLNALAGRFKIVTIDWPGHGKSGPDTTPVSAQRYASLLEKLLDKLRIKNSILMGNSIGGAASIILAANRPDLVNALVLSSPGGLEPPTAFTRTSIALMIKFFKSGEAKRRWFGAAFSLYYRIILPLAPKRRAAIVKNWPQTIGAIRGAWESFGLAEADLRAHIKQVKCPIWFAWAKSDRIVAYSRSRKAVEALPNATVQLFKGGHTPFLEDTEAFVKGFEGFVAALPAPGPD